MSLKTTIQHFMGTLRCIRNGVPLGGRVYIGKNVHFVNGKTIRLGKNI